MTNDEVWSAVVRWVKATTGVLTIKSHEGADDPNPPYAMVNFTGAFEVRRHEQNVEYEYADTGDMDTGDEFPAVTARPIIEMEWRFSVHGYSLSKIDPVTKKARTPRPADPTDILRPIVSAHKLTQAMEPMFPNLTVHEISQIRNVPDWINNAWQPRAQMDVIVRGIIRDSAGTVDIIEQTSPIVIERQD